MKTLFTTIADLSNHTGVAAKLADRLLIRVAPQQTATAVPCGPWAWVSCCGGARPKYRRYCFRGSNAHPEYRCGTSYFCV